MYKTLFAALTVFAVVTGYADDSSKDPKPQQESADEVVVKDDTTDN